MKHSDIVIGPYSNNVKGYLIQTKQRAWIGQKPYAQQNTFQRQMVRGIETKPGLVTI